jgi:hypothetical protein
MKGKVVMGSIFAAAMIILVSFVSVVGYQSIKIKESESSSPLFTIRTLRATQKAYENSLTSNYLGKGKSVWLSFQRTEFITKENIEQISSMIAKGNLGIIDSNNQQKLNLILEIIKNNLPEINKLIFEKKIDFNMIIAKYSTLGNKELKNELLKELNKIDFIDLQKKNINDIKYQLETTDIRCNLTIKIPCTVWWGCGVPFFVSLFLLLTVIAILFVILIPFITIIEKYVEIRDAIFRFLTIHGENWCQ